MVNKVLLLGALLIIAIAITGCFCCCNPDSRTYSPPYRATKKPTPTVQPIVVTVIIQPSPVPTPVTATVVPTVNVSPRK